MFFLKFFLNRFISMRKPSKIKFFCLRVMGEMLAIDFSANDYIFELHFVASEGSSLIGQDVLDLT